MLDLYSRRVVGWATSTTNDRELALAALQQAVKRRKPPPGLIHNSDRGSPYASADYSNALKRIGIVASMNRKARLTNLESYTLAVIPALLMGHAATSLGALDVSIASTQTSPASSARSTCFETLSRRVAGGKES
jgi:transposase InsO family protein